MELTIPIEHQKNFQAYIKNRFPLRFCLENLKYDSSFEKYLETHPKEFNILAVEYKTFNKEKLKRELTLRILDSLDFPFQTTKVSTRKAEIIEWLEENPAYKTNDVELLAQRIRHAFLIKFPSRPPSPNLSEYLKEGIKELETE